MPGGLLFKKLRNILLYGIIYQEVIPVIDLLKKVTENQRFRIIAYLAGGRNRGNSTLLSHHFYHKRWGKDY